MTVSPLELSFAGLTDAPHLSVDGLQPHGPNLSHWPGNRTPARYKSDLTTGICMRFARASELDQQAFLGGVGTVVNDHYDTDGFLSLLAILEPDLVLENAELCLLAAMTGDFQIYTSDRAFCVDAIVRNLAREGSPIAEHFAHLQGAERDLARYRWLCEHGQEVLSIPVRLSGLYAEELAGFHTEYRAALEGSVTRKIDRVAQLSILESEAPIHRYVANTLAGQFRVLMSVRTAGGMNFTYYDRVESWFEVCTIVPPPRRDLRPIAKQLTEMEREGAQWHADPPTCPVPELRCGKDHRIRPGHPSQCASPSSLARKEVHQVLSQAFTCGPTH